jgi:hypothetical protein
VKSYCLNANKTEEKLDNARPHPGPLPHFVAERESESVTRVVKITTHSVLNIRAEVERA